MSDDVKALIAEAREVASWMTPSDGHIAEVLEQCADALEAVQQTPAVDREALAHEVARWLPVTMQDPDEWALDRARLIVQWLIASGILQDAAEVEARGLEKAEKIARDVEAEAVVKRDESDYPESHYGQHLDGQARGAQVVAQRIAQQVREGN